jgi:hypothetical protein
MVTKNLEFTAVEDEGLTYGKEPDADGRILNLTSIKQEIRYCRRFIKEFLTKAKRIQKNHSSYGYKHMVERWSLGLDRKFKMIDRWGHGEWRAQRLYVSNGSFIKAMICEGYTAIPTKPFSPNAYFNAKMIKKQF